MSPSPRFRPVLSDDEWELILELLERERSDLPAEIHHTDTADVRESLQKRLQTVSHLIQVLSERAA